MKKSKILIPAFAVLALSVGASVTGTVAWFTASRSATFGSTFATKDLEGSLSVKSTGLIGTTEGTSGNITVDGGLYHGSYDAQKGALGNLYLPTFGDETVEGKPVINGYNSRGNVENGKTGAKPTTGTEISSTWYAGQTKANDGVNAWYAVAWSMKVSLVNPNPASEDYLFVSFKGSKFTGEGDTIKGLRIAFMTSESFTVVAGDEASSHVIHSGVVDGTHEIGSFTGNYDNTTNYGVNGENYAEANDSTSETLKSNKGYLGKIDHANGIEVTAVAWFEGENPNVATGKALSDVSASIKVYSRSAI